MYNIKPQVHGGKVNWCVGPLPCTAAHHHHHHRDFGHQAGKRNRPKCKNTRTNFYSLTLFLDYVCAKEESDGIVCGPS